ncbi:MAG: B12-binding domain-containing radical SAM protein, partial [Candidatus Binataceae bacterium]
MRVLLVHPSPLMYSEIYLRLEPLGMERVAAALRDARHEVRILDLQIFAHRDLMAEISSFDPRAIGFSLNYLANVPEVVDLVREIKQRRKDCFVFVGGHSASFIADELLAHSEGAIDCIVRGEGEEITQRLVEAIDDGGFEKLPGIVTAAGAGPAPVLMKDVERFPPAR